MGAFLGRPLLRDACCCAGCSCCCCCIWLGDESAVRSEAGGSPRRRLACGSGCASGCRGRTASSSGVRRRVKVLTGGDGLSMKSGLGGETVAIAGVSALAALAPACATDCCSCLPLPPPRTRSGGFFETEEGDAFCEACLLWGREPLPVVCGPDPSLAIVGLESCGWIDIAASMRHLSLTHTLKIPNSRTFTRL
jgi:hypothetical protein